MTQHVREQLQETLGSAYTLERELGGGGMSKVFVAEEHRLKRKVVVKVLSPELAQGLSGERFEREIHTAAALQQANIVPVLSAGETHGLPFYMMPYVEGESLRARLARGPLSITEVIGVLRDVSKALAYAHRQGVVHRDIKPDNVLLSEGTAVVTDFGIAKAITAARADSGGPTLTQIGTSIGTPAYMAPEQAAGDPGVDHRADIYSLGAMGYELLTGQPLFAGRTPQRMLAAHMTEEPTPVGQVRLDVPAPLAQLLMQCLAKDVDARPASASEIARVLDTITSGSGMQALPPVLLGGPGMFRKALALYAIAFVLVAVVAKAAIMVIGLPDWVFPGTLVVMALGLPVVLVTGYVQHVTRRAMLTTPTYTPGGTPSMEHGRIATMALKAAPHVSWYRTARGGMYALAVFTVLIAGFMTMRALGIGPVGSLLATGALNQQDQLLIDDFRTTNTDSTLGRVVSDAVRAGLAGSSAFTLVPPSAVVNALQRMKLATTTRVDSAVARQIAVRDGYKAVVDGEITGVPGGYILAVRLVRADSGVELASFRETGDGPRGLIDAADKLARAIRSKAGESLRDVNATPPLFQVTTVNLDALRKFSDAVRRNALGDPRSIDLNREAVALDSTFASAWSALGATLSNYGGPRSSIDSAVTQAYRYRDKLPDVERDMIAARYYALGPGRDRARAIAFYESVLQRRRHPGALVNLAEQLRQQREFARAESLNAESARLAPANGTAYGNMIEMQLNLGQVDSAAATVARLRPVSVSYATARDPFVLFARGDFKAVHALADSLRREPRDRGGLGGRNVGLEAARSSAMLEGRLRDFEWLSREMRGDSATVVTGAGAPEAVSEIAIFSTLRGSPAANAIARLDSAIARIPFREMAMVDRPYLGAAEALALLGQPEKARAMLARYRAEVTDTSIRREQEADVHSVLGEIALASHDPQEALKEFRRGDVGYDGAPANECAPCLPYNLARAFDAAGQSDSAIVMYERYLSTPFWLKMTWALDPARVPAIRERLGQLYESIGDTQKAAMNYVAFVELWKNADVDLQPRVAAARARLRRMQLDAPKR